LTALRLNSFALRAFMKDKFAYLKREIEQPLVQGSSASATKSIDD
jgi:hypothetical protein